MAIQAQMYSENNNIGFGIGVSQDLLVDNACGGFNNFCLIPNQQVQKQQFMEFDQFQNLSHHKHMNTSFTNQPLMMASCSDVSLQLEKQRVEIDRLITLQNERLRYALQEQRKQQMTTFLKKHEAKVEYLLKQKDEEIKRAANRGMELQDFLKRMEIENLTWQRIAKENETMVTSLNSTIERLRENADLACNEADDAESCCGGEEERIENKGTTICKSCNSRDACVIILPCRHLCACKCCEAFIDFCPVCKMVKKASIEALL